MRIIGITGGIACGKSTVTARLKALGAQIVDADHISAQLTAENGIALEAIREAFGKHVFYLDGTLNRRALGELVFEKPEEREKLNAILHPLIEAEIRRHIEKCREAGAQVVVLDVPLLFETGLDKLCDWVLCCYVDKERQVSRIAQRDGMNEEQARARMQSQWPTEKKLELADEGLCTDAPIEETWEKVDAFWERQRSEG